MKFKINKYILTVYREPHEPSLLNLLNLNGNINMEIVLNRGYYRIPNTNVVPLSITKNKAKYYIDIDHDIYLDLIEYDTVTFKINNLEMVMSNINCINTHELVNEISNIINFLCLHKGDSSFSNYLLNDDLLLTFKHVNNKRKNLDIDKLYLDLASSENNRFIVNKVTWFITSVLLQGKTLNRPGSDEIYTLSTSGALVSYCKTYLNIDELRNKIDTLNIYIALLKKQILSNKEPMFEIELEYTLNFGYINNTIIIEKTNTIFKDINIDKLNDLKSENDANGSIDLELQTQDRGITINLKSVNMEETDTHYIIYLKNDYNNYNTSNIIKILCNHSDFTISREYSNYKDRIKLKSDLYSIANEPTPSVKSIDNYISKYASVINYTDSVLDLGIEIFNNIFKDKY